MVENLAIKSKAVVLLLVLSFCIVPFFLNGCTTTNSFGYGYTSRYFVDRGWMKVNRLEPGEDTPYKRIQYEMKRGRIKAFISSHGTPDYYYTTDLWDVYYGYTSSGIIYHINTKGSGQIIEQFNYLEISSNLPHHVLADFENANKQKETPVQNIEQAKQPDKPIQKEEAIIGSGSGFFISNNGYILTNHHVVSDANHVDIYFKKKLYPADIIAFDGINDIALLKIDSQSKGLFLDYMNSDKGENVASFGYPLIDLQGSELKVTFGYINSLSGVGGDIRYFQIDTPIQPGSSGGPLVNQYGGVIGIVSAALSQKASIERSGTINQNVNYAIKIGYAAPLMTQFDIELLNENKQTKLPTTELVKKVTDSVVIVITKK